MNYNNLINKLYTETDCNRFGNINTGCCISDRVTLDNTTWSDSNKIFEWKCGYHKSFLRSLAEKSIYDIVHKLNIRSCEQILTRSQIKNFTNNFKNLTKECLLCKNNKHIDSKIKPYFRLPINTGTSINVCISKLLLNDNISVVNPILIDLNGYDSSELYIFHSFGFTKVLKGEQNPIWELYKKYITFDVVSKWNNSIDGLHINDHLLISFDNKNINTLDISSSDFIDLQNDIDAPTEILDALGSTCYINNYNQLNKHQLDILLKDYKKIIIDYFKFQLIIEKDQYLIKFNNQTIIF